MTRNGSAYPLPRSAHHTTDSVSLSLPILGTPRTSSSNGVGQYTENIRGTRGRLEAQVDQLLRTPTAQLAVNGGSQHPDKRKAGGHGPTLADEVEHLLPTPAVNDMGEGKTPEQWDAWTSRMRAKHGNGNGHGASLAIEAQRTLLPTPTARDEVASGGSQPGYVTLTDATVRTRMGTRPNPRHGDPTDLQSNDGRLF